jgi:hypothetical protein
MRKVWPSRGSRTAHRVFASRAVVGAAVLASRYMAAVQHRIDAQAFHRAGRGRGGRPVVVEERQQLGGVVRRGDSLGPGVEVQPSSASCAFLLHGQQPGSSSTRPPVPAARAALGSSTGVPSSSFPSSPSFLPSLVAANLWGKSMGSVVQGVVAGDWALIGGRLGFGAPEGRRGSSASVPAATRRASGGAGEHGTRGGRRYRVGRGRRLRAGHERASAGRRKGHRKIGADLRVPHGSERRAAGLVVRGLVG